MLKSIQKRDGRIVAFDSVKIQKAINKTIKELDFDMSLEEIATISDDVVFVCEELYGKKEICSVEQVQDVVIKELDNKGYSDIASAYSIYRADRNKVRTMKSDLMKTYEKLTFMDSEDLSMKRENANIDTDTAMGTMLKYGSEGAKQFAHLYLLKPEHSKAHTVGDIHIHDLDFMGIGTLTCCQIPLDKLFKGGFNTGHGFLREPNDIMSYSALACIAIQSNQNEQHGGQSIPMLDYYLAPGVAKTFIKKYVEVLDDKYDICEDKLEDLTKLLRGYLSNNKTILDEKGKNYFKSATVSTIQTLLVDAPFFNTIGFDKIWAKALKKTNKQTYQAMESLIHNLNTMHSRAGSQIPFSSVNYGMDTSEEGRIVMKNLLLATEAGLGNGETPIFPIQVMQIKEGVNYNPNDPNYDIFKLGMKVSAKRLFPNFLFVDAPFNLQYYKEGVPESVITTMGCRTRVIGNTYDKNNEICAGRGNISFTSINLPRLAIESGRGNLDTFFNLLDKKLELVAEQLLDRMEIQGKKKVKNFPFLMGQGVWLGSENLGMEDTLEEVIKQGTLSIGFIGLAECLTALIGVHHGQSEEAQELGLKIVKRMREYTDKLSVETGLNFSVIGTPAEGLSDRFLKIDRELYGVIEGVTDKDFYTNSNHIPVNFPISAFDKIRLEAPYHVLTNAGHITYIELDGDPSKNLDAYESVVRHMKESGIGYGAINHPVDRCPNCSYTGVIDDECPNCGVKDGEVEFDRIRRITGYLVGSLNRFGSGKQAEERLRVKHSTSSI